MPHAPIHSSLTVSVGSDGRWISLASVEPDADGGVIRLGPPSWWTGKGSNWRLSGTLWRRSGVLSSKVQGRDTAGFHSGLVRTLAGFEARLGYSPAAGRGRGGKLPEALVPVRSGKWGPSFFLPWTDCLTLAGEPVPENPKPDSDDSPAYKRYRNRIEALFAAGYGVPVAGGSAPAGDTVEIVKRQRGTRAEPAGVWIRASARFCEAAGPGRRWERVPASRLWAE